jgi:hypothetical protein
MRRLHLTLPALVLLAACESAPPADPTAGPTVTLVDSVVLADPDTFALAAGADAVARSAAGDLFIQAEDRVLHFGPDGAFRGTIGTPGEGPGELRRVQGLQLLPGDSILAVVSVGRGALVLFRTDDHTVVREFHPGVSFSAGQQWVFVGGTVFVPTLFSSTPFIRWEMANDSVVPWGVPPPASMDGRSRAYIFGGELSAAVAPGGLLALAPMHTNLLRYDPTGAILGGVNLPRHRRRAVPSDAEEQMQELTRRTPPEFKFVAPFVMGIHRLPNGDFVTVHFDAETTTIQEPLHLEYANPRYWIGIVSADLSRACVDGAIPDPPAAAIRPIFHGDTVSLLVRELPDDGEPRSVLRSYLVSQQGCAWVATGAGVR